MNESKHTPGPWLVNIDKHYCNGKPGIIWTAKGPGHGAICNMSPIYPHDFNLANARLIAAAPDLLGVCKSVRLELDLLLELAKLKGVEYVETVQRRIIQVNTAIAKAEEGK